MSAVTVGDDLPARPSLARVEFFMREPTGGTLFVRPADADREVAICDGSTADDKVVVPS